MSKSDARILRLVDLIDQGLISPDVVDRKLDSYERTHGALDILYDVDARSDSDYYDELLANARIGIYNRASLIKMAEIRYKGSDEENDRSIMAIVFAGILVIAVITGVIIATFGGESR